VKIKISTRGQLVLPAELRAQDSILPGQQFEIKRLRSGEYLLHRLPTPKMDLVEWLGACPEKDWFQPIASEGTDAL